MSSLTETIIVVFTLIALGYGSAAFKLIKESTGDGLADFVFTIAIPLLLFRTIAHSEFDEGLPLGLWATYFSAVIGSWMVGHFLTRLFFGRDVRSGVVAGMTGSYSNLVLIGIPLMTGIYGDKGLAVISQIVSIHLPLMMAATILAFDYAMRRDGLLSKPVGFAKLAGSFLRQLLSNPLIIGILAGLLMRATGLSLPRVADRVIISLGTVGGPLALFSMGVSLFSYGIRGQVPHSLALVGAKSFLMPAFALGMAILIGLPGATAKVVVVAASLPAGVNTWLIASRLSTGERLASTSMTIGTAVAALTCSFWLAIVEAVFQNS